MEVGQEMRNLKLVLENYGKVEVVVAEVMVVVVVAVCIEI